MSHTPIGYMSNHTSRHSIPRHWYAWEDILPGAWWSQLNGDGEAEGLEIRRLLYRCVEHVCMYLCTYSYFTVAILCDSLLLLHSDSTHPTPHSHSHSPSRRTESQRTRQFLILIASDCRTFTDLLLEYCWPITRNLPFRTCSPRIGALISLRGF